MFSNPSGKVQAELHPITKLNILWLTFRMDAISKLSNKNDQKEYVILTYAKKIDTNNSIRALKKNITFYILTGSSRVNGQVEQVMF